jgi:hypothetical protein
MKELRELQTQIEQLSRHIAYQDGEIQAQKILIQKKDEKIFSLASQLADAICNSKFKGAK